MSQGIPGRPVTGTLVSLIIRQTHICLLSVHWYCSELDHSHIVWEVAGGINTKLKKGLASTKAAYGTYYEY